MAYRKRNKRIRRIFYSIITTAIMLIGVIILWKTWNFHKVKTVRYPEFGIPIPEKYSIHGIDVSRYQEMIAWEEVKAMKVKNIQLGFSFIKATEGIETVDPQFRRNWKNSKDNSIIRGAYHFFIPSKDGKTQAKNFIDEVKLQPGDLPPVLDIEQLNGTPFAELKKEAKEWLEEIENYYKVKPIIYTYVDFYNNYLGSEFDKYPLWAAHYYQSDQPRINRSWLFWQHNDGGRVNGIFSKVDFDVFNGDSLDFKNLLLR
jgi:lysozyme